ncbi:MAG: site-2 protease family protein [Clostridia bacterium]|nr:site-2 protease family protein [Clostridia bacterium]
MMRILHVEVESITIHFFGADIKRRPGELSYTADLAISLGGIIANSAAALLLLPFSFFPVAKLFIFCNITLAVMNLLPIRSLDGGEALAAFLMLVLPRHLGEKLLRGVSFVFIFLLWCAAVYIPMFSGGNPSLFFICIYLFSSIFLSNHGDYI